MWSMIKWLFYIIAVIGIQSTEMRSVMQLFTDHSILQMQHTTN